ncbi:hypothetical protein [Aquitalea sp.]|uniref:hypothetical protein n=1 Tax=Aquitalea sp. TaxID=1872623 RepID=UPI00258728BC|nr:hypothetical protein [Aquitalea sp.]
MATNSADTPVLPGMTPAVQDNTRQALSQSLQQALNQWRQQQAALQKQAQSSKQSTNQPLDAGRMEMLKERVKNLRQMLLLVGRDKAGLRAIAMQLKQISAELRQMVANATGQAQPQGMTVNVSMAAAGNGQTGADTAATGDVASASATTPGQSMAVDSGNKESSDGTDTASTSRVADAGNMPAGNGVATGLSGNMELQTLINSIKAIQQWLRQRQQQTQDESLKKWLDDSSKDMAAITNMLNGGSNNAEGELNLQVELAGSGTDGSNGVDVGSAGVNGQA